jgi:hypothetical protein
MCISVILSCFINADIEYWRPSVSYSTKILQFCRQMSKHVSDETIVIWYGIRLQVNVLPQCRSTLQYVVSYVKFLEDFAQTKYCSSKEKKIQIFVEYDTLDRIYKFEDKQMKTVMTLGHKCFVTQFSTKEVLYYDDFLKNYWKFYMACWIPISIIYNFSFRKYIANFRWKQVENLPCVVQ